MKTTNLLNWLILILLFATGAITNIRLEQISNDIKNYSIPKLSITDNEQFETLCIQLNDQWDSKDYAMYILQPNSNAKTHKELASSSIKNLPIKAKLIDYDKKMNKKDSYYYGSADDFNSIMSSEFDTTCKFVMIPIYRYNIVIAEMFVFYDDIPENFDNRVTEAQQLNNLIQ